MHYVILQSLTSALVYLKAILFPLTCIATVAPSPTSIICQSGQQELGPNLCSQYICLIGISDTVSDGATKTLVLNNERTQHIYPKDFEPDLLNTFCETRV